MNMKEYSLAMSVLEKASALDPNNLLILSALGRLSLQYGNVKHAQNLFASVSTLAKSESDLILTKYNQAFLFVAEGEWDTGGMYWFVDYQLVDRFSELSTLCPSSICAANNLAICQLFNGRVKKGIELLDDVSKSKLGQE